MPLTAPLTQGSLGCGKILGGNNMAKLARKLLAHIINIGTAEAPQYVRLGKDLEEYTPQLSAQVERSRDILGNNNVYITGYEKSGEVGTFFCEEEEPLFDFLRSIIDHGKTMDEVKVETIDLYLWERDGCILPGARETAYIEITGYGGGTTGVQISFNLHYAGDREPMDFDTGIEPYDRLLAYA